MRLSSHLRGAKEGDGGTAGDESSDGAVAGKSPLGNYTRAISSDAFSGGSTIWGRYRQVDLFSFR
jgi:hypothetical protein